MSFSAYQSMIISLAPAPIIRRRQRPSISFAGWRALARHDDTPGAMSPERAAAHESWLYAAKQREEPFH